MVVCLKFKDMENNHVVFDTVYPMIHFRVVCEWEEIRGVYRKVFRIEIPKPFKF